MKLPVTVCSRGVSDGALVIKDADHNEVCCFAEKAQRHYGPEDKQRIADAEFVAKAINSQCVLTVTLARIAEVCNGYGEEAGWANKVARDALRVTDSWPDV